MTTWILFESTGYGMEPIISYDNRKEALEDLKCYRENDREHYHAVQRRELKKGQDWQNCRFRYN